MEVRILGVLRMAIKPFCRMGVLIKISSYILCILLLSLGCATKKSDQLYSPEFFEHITSSGIILSHDSLIFPESAGNVIILIPNELNTGTHYIFENEIGETISVSRLNYTDYSYHLSTKDINETGHISLFPYFYMGAEFRGESGELVIAPHYNTDKKNRLCLYEFGIGSYSLEEGEIETFVTVKLNSKCGELDKTVFKLKEKVKQQF